MKIISKYNDYYDGVMKGQSDSSIQYIRKPIVLDGDDIRCRQLIYYIKKHQINALKRIDFKYERGMKYYHEYSNLDASIIIFCGKIYPLISLHKTISIIRLNLKSETTNIYSGEELVSYIQTNNKNYEITNKSNEKIKIYYSMNSLEINDIKQYQIINKSPIIIIDYNQYNNDKPIITLNSCDLHKFKFAKIFDPYQSFQEIQMFVSGMMIKDSPEMINISDKIRAEKHGFDKWSFRKPPSK